MAGVFTLRLPSQIRRLEPGTYPARIGAMRRIVCLLALLTACSSPNGNAAADAPTDTATGQVSLTDPCDHVQTLTGQKVLEMMMAAYGSTFTPSPMGTPSALALAPSY